MSFRLEQFADAASAQAAFEAGFPVGSPAEPALQALVDMGAQCKSAGPGKVACRYVEPRPVLAGWSWQVVLEADAGKAIQRVAVAAALVGI